MREQCVQKHDARRPWGLIWGLGPTVVPAQWLIPEDSRRDLASEIPGLL